MPAVVTTQTVAEEKEKLDAPVKALLTSSSYSAKTKVVVESLLKGQAAGRLETGAYDPRTHPAASRQ